MARSNVIRLRPRTPRVPRFSAAILTESHMEAAEAARRVLAFTEGELRESFQSGDLRRLRVLQSVHRDASTVLAEHRKQAGWSDAACGDGVVGLNHGRAS